MPRNDIEDTYDVTMEHVRYLRRNGVSPAEAAASVGWYPPDPVGWDDVTFMLARRLHALRWGGIAA